MTELRVRSGHHVVTGLTLRPHVGLNLGGVDRVFPLSLIQE
ncbi:MAG: hypothetical protein WBZ00_16440 [Solirubrobacterales bacterium]